MLERFTHTNCKNETLDFIAMGIYANYNDLRDYEWSVSKSNDKITKLYKGVSKKKIPFTFLVQENASEIKDEFYEHFDVDVVSGKQGYFEINGYKMYCYVTKASHSEYLIDKKYMKVTLEITTDKPYWEKETTRHIDFSKAESESKTLTYPFTYPFTYNIERTVKLVNENFVESDGIIRIYGACIDPLIKIGNNIYQVNTTLSSGEYLEIDTLNKTVYQFSQKGTKTNIFHLRNKEHSIFSKIPSGAFDVIVSEMFVIDIVIKEKRGVPRWN